jgi:hypothetical protein
MFYRIIREFNDGRLYYRGGSAGEGASWTEMAESARHYRSADESVRVGATVAALVEAGRVGVEEIDTLPVDARIAANRPRRLPRPTVRD